LKIGLKNSQGKTYWKGKANFTLFPFINIYESEKMNPTLCTSLVDI
jgi:hypothetical protein